MTAGRNDANHPNRQVHRDNFPDYQPDHWNPEMGESFWKGKEYTPPGQMTLPISGITHREKT